MIVYHYSQTLKEGDRVEPGHNDFTDLCEPFIEALAFSWDCFYAMLLNGKYMYAVLNRSNLRCWADYAKWASEGLFEYVRKNEFPQCVSRLHCNYFCADVQDCIRMYNENYCDEDEEERSKVRLFEVETDVSRFEKRDISLFDATYDAIEGRDTEKAFECARKYFSGMSGDEPEWELLSAGEAAAVKDITYLLYDR